MKIQKQLWEIRHRLSVNYIIKLLDDNLNHINFNGLDWSICLEIKSINKFNPNHTNIFSWGINNGLMILEDNLNKDNEQRNQQQLKYILNNNNNLLLTSNNQGNIMGSPLQNQVLFYHI